MFGQNQKKKNQTKKLNYQFKKGISAPELGKMQEMGEAKKAYMEQARNGISWKYLYRKP